jgi:glycosyltransferase involved in cell wall biosynthesis
VTDLPTISIVTPSYQHGQFLEWTIRSVLLQRYPNLEYVVMDGGSTDETPHILNRYEKQFAHLESAPDRGQADAVARGFTHTRGEIMAYLNSDDLLAPGALDFVGRFFIEHPYVDSIYSHRIFINEVNIVDAYWILPQHRNWMMKHWDYIPQETCFWRRRIYDQAGGIDPSFQFALDYDLFVRFMKLGRMERVNRFLGAFRRHAASKTATLTEGSVHPEVARVRNHHDIWFPRGHGLMELALSKWVTSSSRKFAARATTLPGALPGVGYDYDRVWQGQLTLS